MLIELFEAVKEITAKSFFNFYEIKEQILFFYLIILVNRRKRNVAMMSLVNPRMFHHIVWDAFVPHFSLFFMEMNRIRVANYLLKDLVHSSFSLLILEENSQVPHNKRMKDNFSKLLVLMNIYNVFLDPCITCSQRWEESLKIIKQLITDLMDIMKLVAVLNNCFYKKISLNSLRNTFQIKGCYFNFVCVFAKIHSDFGSDIENLIDLLIKIDPKDLTQELKVIRKFLYSITNDEKFKNLSYELKVEDLQNIVDFPVITLNNLNYISNQFLQLYNLISSVQFPEVIELENDPVIPGKEILIEYNCPEYCYVTYDGLMTYISEIRLPSICDNTNCNFPEIQEVKKARDIASKHFKNRVKTIDMFKKYLSRSFLKQLDSQLEAMIADFFKNLV